jgi:hypothetical protein
MLIFAAVSSLYVQAAWAERSPTYDCTWGTENARLNFADHIATYAGKDIELSEGITFGFDPPAGGFIVFDVGFAMDVIHFDQPKTMSGTATLTQDLVDDKVMPVHCTLHR